MTVSVADQVFLVLGLSIFSGAFICIGLSLYMAYTKRELMLEQLKNCSIVRTHAPLKDGGPWGKLMLLGWIAGVFAFPEYYLKRGQASHDDLNNFPVHLRNKLVMLKWASFVLFTAMVVLFIFRKSGLLK
ncbi:hypothetical protein [Pseudomonas saxonica]|uniref:hypothetical protein n=2 Tax=Pseudomonas saxonica TaxID=2600598 RepID=UPI001F2D435D|nr:hypothetical protein [Pseudomonas saxonica]